MLFDPTLQLLYELFVTGKSSEVNFILQVTFNVGLRHCNEHATFQSIQTFRQVRASLELSAPVGLLLLVEMLRIVGANDKRSVLDEHLGCNVEPAFFDRLKFLLAEVISTQDRVLTTCDNTGPTTSLVGRTW